MKTKHQNKPGEQITIAKERILRLFNLAGEIFKEDRKLADRYVQLALKISMKYKVAIPSKLKRQFCKNCNCYLVPSVNCRVRVSKGKLIYYCQACRHFMRFSYKK